MKLASVRGLSKAVDAKLSGAFGSLARVVTTWPILTIIATTLLAFALAPGMGMAKREANGEKLWTPQDTEATRQQDWVFATFGAAERRVRAYSTGNGVNLLTQSSLEALQKLHTGIFSLRASCETGSCDGQTVTYDMVRSKNYSSVLSLWGDKAPPVGTDILAVVNDQSKWLTTSGNRLKLSDMLGGVQYDSNGKIVSAEAFVTTLWLKNERESVDDTETDPTSEAWELEFDDFVFGFYEASLPSNYPWSSAGQLESGGNAIQKDVRLLSFGYIFLMVFSIIVLSHHKRIHSNGVMALASVLCVALSVVSAFGLCSYFGVKQNPVTTTLFLVLLGIGVDDSYVIMGDYRNARGTAQERVVQALTKAGTSISVTTMTGSIAFAAGISSTLPALSDFCIFAAVGIFVDFFFQCTWFVAILTLRARCTEHNRPDLLCCVQVDPESKGGKCACCPCSWDKDQGETDSISRFAIRKITSFTMTRPGSAVVFVLTLGVLTGAIVGLPKLKTDFQLKWFTPDDSDYQDTYKIKDKYFSTSGAGLPVYLYTKNGNYASAHADGSLSGLYQRMASCKWVASSVSNWYSEFAKDAGRSARSKASEASFAAEVKAFVSSSEGARFLKDIVFVDDGNGGVSRIKGSRALYVMKDTENGREQIDMTESSRKCVDGKPLSAFPFTSPFLYYDGLAVVDKETIQNVIIACVCVFLVNLVMLADLAAATLVLTMIGLVDVCILGYMAHWGMDFNSVTAINLVLAVGLAVDYSAHIAHSFLVAQGPGIERAKQAVDHIGVSVCNGAFSTFLAVLPLGLSQSYVFRVFFKMWFLIIVFGVFFGVIVLPVVLSTLSCVIGAPSSEGSDGEYDREAVKNTTVPRPSTMGQEDQFDTVTASS